MTNISNQLIFPLKGFHVKIPNKTNQNTNQLITSQITATILLIIITVIINLNLNKSIHFFLVNPWSASRRHGYSYTCRGWPCPNHPTPPRPPSYPWGALGNQPASLRNRSFPSLFSESRSTKNNPIKNRDLIRSDRLKKRFEEKLYLFGKVLG